MTREKAEAASAVMLSYANGKKIELKLKQAAAWDSCDGVALVFNWEDFDYRIKPEPKPPKYRAWTINEVPIGAIIRLRGSTDFFTTILGTHRGRVMMAHTEGIKSYELYCDFENKDVSTDGGKTFQPCGVLVEEGAE